MNAILVPTGHQNYAQNCSICRMKVDVINWFNYCFNCESSFHSQHLRIWLLYNHTCPHCRIPIHSDILAYYRIEQPINNHSISRRLYNTDSFDITQNRAASKEHISYFDHKIVRSRQICSCTPFRVKLLGNLSDFSTFNKWGIRFIFTFSYFILAFFSLQLLLLDPDKHLNLFLWGIMICFYLIFHVFFAMIYAIISYKVSKSDCPAHNISIN